MTEKDIIRDMTHCSRFITSGMEHAKAEIWKVHDSYLLFKEPRLKQLPKFCKRHVHADDLIKEIESWKVMTMEEKYKIKYI